MTRLADALKRANEQHDHVAAPRVPAEATVTAAAAPARGPAAAPVAVTHRIAVPPPPAVDSRPIHMASRRDRAEIAPVAAGGTSLIARATRDVLTTWRTDAELVGKIVGTDGFSGAAQEQYRKLAAILHHAQVERGIKVIMTSSALPGEGKSLTAVNLALTLSESYHRRVLLIDADLRRPTVQRIFGIPPIAGLNEGLKASEDRPMALTPVSERLFVLPAGRPEADPMSGLTSE